MIYAALASALWGGLYVVSQLTFSQIPPATLSAGRLAIGAGALALVLRQRPALLERRLLLLGILVAVTILAQAWGTYLSGAATGSLLTITTPVFVAVMAPLVLRERTRSVQWLGIGVGLVGAAVVIGPAGAGSWLGDLMLIAAALTWAMFTVVGASLVRERGALQVTAGAATWALPFSAAAAAFELGSGAHIHPSLSAAAGLLYLGLAATALGWWAWYRGVERAPAAAAAVPFLLQPVVGVGLSTLLAGHPPGLGFLAGGLLVAAGMVVASR